MIQYNTPPKKIEKASYKPIHYFDIEADNIDTDVVESFGDEWEKFNNFSDEELQKIGNQYFSFLGTDIINDHTYALDVGCGTGRWTKYLSSKVNFIEAIDPSKAILSADKLLKNVDNVRLSVASTDNIPFADETFDFVMSVGVLHHIPDTQKAMIDCVKKVKKGGFFYVYLYYALDNRGFLFKFIYNVSNLVRLFVSKLPPTYKKIVSDFLAFTVYLPFVGLAYLISFLGFEKLAKKIPLSDYRGRSFFIIRNDALDRFGTKLEQRFTKEEITIMMTNAGLTNINIPNEPVRWAAIGQKN
jgi:ubiquinone/menaquinone biosynthesis C-methylase UbiE